MRETDSMTATGADAPPHAREADGGRRSPRLRGGAPGRRPPARPDRLPLWAHAVLSRYRAMLAPHHPLETALDHYFIAPHPPVGPVRFAERLIDPWTLCRLGWWIRGSRLELTRYDPRHLAIQVTYPGLDHPNVEVALHADPDGLRLELEGVYLFDLKGAGLGACAMWHCALAARKIGCRRIGVQASGNVTREEEGDIGYYAWPRMGFDAPLRMATLSRLTQAAPEMVDCRTVRDVLERDKAVWRAAAATVSLGFDLADDSPDLDYLRRYLARRHLLI